MRFTSDADFIACLPIWILAPEREAGKEFAWRRPGMLTAFLIFSPQGTHFLVICIRWQVARRNSPGLAGPPKQLQPWATPAASCAGAEAFRDLSGSLRI